MCAAEILVFLSLGTICSWFTASLLYIQYDNAVPVLEELNAYSKNIQIFRNLWGHTVLLIASNNLLTRDFQIYC